MSRVRILHDSLDIALFAEMGFNCLRLSVAWTRLFPTGEFAKRYGFVYVDMDDEGNGDLHRLRKDSFYDYQRIIASNGEEV